MKLIFLALFLIFIPKTKACLGLIFIDEQRIKLCNQFEIMQNASIDIVYNYFSNASGYALRGYGDNTVLWFPLAWYNKLNFISWITSQETLNCFSASNIYYTDPLQQLLQFINNSNYTSYGLLWGGSLDVISDADTAIPLAQQVAALNIPTFIWDYSLNVTDQQLFKILAHGRNDRILTAQNVTSTDLTNFLLKEAIPLFQQSDCGTVPTPLPFSTTTKPTTSLPHQTTTSAPACSALLFIEEATVAIGADAKLSFLQLAQRLLNTVKFTPNQRFSISLYGNVIYKSIEPQILSVFNKTLNLAIEAMASDNFPNGGLPYMSPILNQLNQTFGSGLYKKYSTLFLAETGGIRDPTAAYRAAELVASYHQDIYVIDQSRSTVPSNLFSTLTGNPSHVLNGTSLSQDQLFASLSNTLINNFNSYGC